MANVGRLQTFAVPRTGLGTIRANRSRFGSASVTRAERPFRMHSTERDMLHAGKARGNWATKPQNGRLPWELRRTPGARSAETFTNRSMPAKLALDSVFATHLANCLLTRNLCQFVGRPLDLAWQLLYLRTIPIDARFQVRPDHRRSEPSRNRRDLSRGSEPHSTPAGAKT